MPLHRLSFGANLAQLANQPKQPAPPSLLSEQTPRNLKLGVMVFYPAQLCTVAVAIVGAGETQKKGPPHELIDGSVNARHPAGAFFFSGAGIPASNL